MTESRDEWIKKRAYSLWEEEGYPTGRDQHHWEQAMKERAVMETTAPHGLTVKPKTTSKKDAVVKVATISKTESSKPAKKDKLTSKTSDPVTPIVVAKNGGKKEVSAKL